jgi:hypothetical protein
MLQADPNRIKVRVEMSMERLQQSAQHRTLLRQAGMAQPSWLSDALRRLLGSAGAVLMALGARREPLPPDPAAESTPSQGQRPLTAPP